MSTNAAVAMAPVAKATWKDYMVLTKPRVISLLLFTTLAAMFIARDAKHPISLVLFLAVAVGGYMSAGSANAINMIIDSDIDGRMKRTTKRPTVTHSISPRNAMLFALTLEFASFGILWWSANLLCASLALGGLLFYVFIYTMLLKRRTWHNIVIGGAAGAFPPLVGWAAVTGDLSVLAWYLFGIIFLWTPVHFWALALLIKEDYAEAGIPMLPVVKGDKATAVQIGIYTVLTVVITLLPAMIGQVKWLYLGTAILLNALLCLRSVQLYQHTDRPHAVSLYKYSMLYLFLLFMAMAFDRAFLA
jgi:protoheme IX farnesyltransferase